MNQLSGRFVNVVLAIEEGKGMGILKTSLNISANLNGRILETDKIECEERPVFNTEFVWEIEKKDLRKIRSMNQPLRVECFSTDTHNRRERVGFCLLSLRSAQIVPNGQAKYQIPFRWQKLIGGQDKKKCKPELFLSLTIRDLNFNEQALVPEPEDLNPEVSMNLQNSDIPVKYLEDGYIQIGADTEANDCFSFLLLIKDAMNLDMLLPEALVFQKNNEKYLLSFTIFGITIKSKTINRDLHEIVGLNERIIVRLMSNLEVLKRFFRKQEVSISFLHGQSVLGVSSLKMGDLINEQLHAEFLDAVLKKSDRCYFKLSNLEVAGFCKDRAPFIDVEKGLKQFWNKNDNDGSGERPKPKTVLSNVVREGSGDGKRSPKVKVPEKEVLVEEPEPASEKPSQIQSVNTVVKSLFVEKRPAAPHQSFEDYSVYSLKVILKKFTWKAAPTQEIVFHVAHPKAENNVTFSVSLKGAMNETTGLHNLSVNLVYISTEQNYKNLIKYYPPRISILDEEENKISREMPVTSPVLQTSNSVTYIQNMINYQSAHLIAQIEIELLITKSMEDDNLTLLPKILDEEINCMELVSFEEWKAAERKQFHDQLAKIKEEEMKNLEKQFEAKKRDLEDKLNEQMQKCVKIQESLKRKLVSIKTQIDFKEAKRLKNFPDLYKNNLKKYGTLPIHQLIEIMTELQRDNDCLKEVLLNYKERIEKCHKLNLTKEQTITLLKELRSLEEQFEEAQKAKSYFKDQWRRACEEIHNLRVEDYRYLRSQIQKKRDQISLLSLDNFLEKSGSMSPYSEIKCNRAKSSVSLYDDLE